MIRLTPRILIPTIKASRTNAAISIFILIPISSSITHKYALNPISANADLSMKLAHNPSPEIVPNNGPNVFWTYTYEPPEVGIAVANSDFEMAAGRTIMAANRYASQTPPTGFEPPPISSIAKAGSTNKPEPNIAEREIMTTAPNPSLRSSGPSKSSSDLRTIPARSLGPLIFTLFRKIKGC